MAVLTSRRVCIPLEFCADYNTVSNSLLACQFTSCYHLCGCLPSRAQVFKKKVGDQGDGIRDARSLSPPSVTIALRQKTKIVFCSFASSKDMSSASKLTLAGTSLSAIGIVVLVHYQQRAEKAVSHPFYDTLSRVIFFPRSTAYVLQAMHAGVIRDIEQQRVKKERQADFEMQRALEEEYRKVQQVHDGDGATEKAGGKG